MTFTKGRLLEQGRYQRGRDESPAAIDDGCPARAYGVPGSDRFLTSAGGAMMLWMFISP